MAPRGPFLPLLSGFCRNWDSRQQTTSAAARSSRRCSSVRLIRFGEHSISRRPRTAGTALSAAAPLNSPSPALPFSAARRFSRRSSSDRRCSLPSPPGAAPVQRAGQSELAQSPSSPSPGPAMKQPEPKSKLRRALLTRAAASAAAFSITRSDHVKRTPPFLQNRLNPS